MAHLSALLNPFPTSPTTFSPSPSSTPSFAMPRYSYPAREDAESVPSSLSSLMPPQCNGATSERLLTNADVTAASSPPSSPSRSTSLPPNRTTSERRTMEVDTILVSSPSPPSSPSRTDSLLRNRATSARHRTKADAIIAGAQAEVDALLELRPALSDLTSALLTSEKIVLDEGLVTTSADYLLRNNWDQVMGSLSYDTATVLRTAVVTDPVAVAMLEVIALRRGIVTNPLGRTPAKNLRDTVTQYNCIMAKLLEDDVTGSRVAEGICEARLNELVALWSRWSSFEGSTPWFLQAKYAVVQDALLAEAVSVGLRPKAVGKRERRRNIKYKCCRRCGVPKTAGNGHRRSICPDGMHVGSGHPYRYIPG